MTEYIPDTDGDYQCPTSHILTSRNISVRDNSGIVNGSRYSIHDPADERNPKRQSVVETRFLSLNLNGCMRMREYPVVSSTVKANEVTSSK
ncbi:unnamed protein product [Allacma fusca]|nr:unnamed protein product [Allacma fusca]